MRIYLICPIRNMNDEQKIILGEYVKNSESSGNLVFYPFRDAPQESETGYEIVESELKAIKECDEVHVFWDANSKGSHFDLGMAYALNKYIRIVYLFQEETHEKSYVKVIGIKNDRSSIYDGCKTISINTF